MLSGTMSGQTVPIKLCDWTCTISIQGAPRRGVLQKPGCSGGGTVPVPSAGLLPGGHPPLAAHSYYCTDLPLKSIRNLSIHILLYYLHQKLIPKSACHSFRSERMEAHWLDVVFGEKLRLHVTCSLQLYRDGCIIPRSNSVLWPDLSNPF